MKKYLKTSEELNKILNVNGKIMYGFLSNMKKVRRGCEDFLLRVTGR